MKLDNIRKILNDVAGGKLSSDTAMKKLGSLSFEDIEFAKLDHHRALRTGVPEVIFAPGKTDRQIITICEHMQKAGSDILITRVGKSTFVKLKRKFKGIKYNEIAKIIYEPRDKKALVSNKIIAVVSAGTADMNVAEEAAITSEVFGARVERVYDIGIAGIHRLLAYQDRLCEASVVIVVAGMEGALASAVGGLVPAPVIAVPTSIGYGASFGGLAALLSMLNSCAPGVTVVNIDNGFGAAMAALKMVKIMERKSR
ncbi:MAG TPA: nickel pincer cofactor biosynthesis protein LarB [candidate division Zixibacteria bacterium]|nr:nickel pincer cofactor biosynthesis protein LarB [candidate division Zixibacteria bacterium]